MVEAFCSKVCRNKSRTVNNLTSFHFDLDVLCFSLLEPYLNKGYI